MSYQKNGFTTHFGPQIADWELVLHVLLNRWNMKHFVEQCSESGVVSFWKL
jgi:hypothetical protein